MEALEGRWEEGFLFFHGKIQGLMKKRSVVEELFKSVNSSLAHSHKTLMVISKAEVDQRREEYDLRKSLQQETFDHKRVKEMIKNAELKINMIESKIKTGIFNQEEILNSRIRMRKQKSESSINGDPEDHPRTFKKKTPAPENLEEQVGVGKEGKGREEAKGRKSLDKREKLLMHFNSFSREIKI